MLSRCAGKDLASGELLLCPAACQRYVRRRGASAGAGRNTVHLLSGKRSEAVGGKHLCRDPCRTELYFAGGCKLSGSTGGTVLCDQRRRRGTVWQRRRMQKGGENLLQGDLPVFWNRPTAAEVRRFEEQAAAASENHKACRGGPEFLLPQKLSTGPPQRCKDREGVLFFIICLFV